MALSSNTHWGEVLAITVVDFQQDHQWQGYIKISIMMMKIINQINSLFRIAAKATTLL